MDENKEVETKVPEGEPSSELNTESADSKLSKDLKDYPFITFINGKFQVAHLELTAFLTPKILKIGDLSRRGVRLANLNGGAFNVDPDTQALNSFIATIEVGYSDLPKEFNPLVVEDTNLITALFVAIRSYNNFFRKTPLNFTL